MATYIEFLTVFIGGNDLLVLYVGWITVVIITTVITVVVPQEKESRKQFS